MNTAPDPTSTAGALSTRLSEALAKSFSIDLRALALFRIAIATVLLFDLLDRSRFLVAHYTDAGIYPAADALQEYGRGLYLSPHLLLSGSTAGEVGLFAIQALFAAAMLLGFHTRIATMASWFLLVSLQARNPYLAAMGGDKFLRLLFFFGIFLPLGACLSLDARRVGRPASYRIATLPGAALLLQIALMYVTTGLQKNGVSWRDGMAVGLALNLEQHQTLFTPWLREMRWLHVPLTHATRAFEIFGPLLAFVPYRNELFRAAAFVAFTGFHLSLAAFLDIGPFPIMCIAAWFVFLPSALFDRWLPALSASFAPQPAGSARVATPRWAQIGAGLAILYVFFANLEQWTGRNIFPAPLRSAGTALRLNQSWKMFAPNPLNRDGWIVIDGQLADGRTINPWTGQATSFVKPADIPATAPGFRWRLYTWYGLMVPASEARTHRHQRFAGFICREWNRDHRGADRLVHVRTLTLIEITGDPPDKPPYGEVMSSLDCPDAN
jgi:hypothetical protein